MIRKIGGLALMTTVAAAILIAQTWRGDQAVALQVNDSKGRPVTEARVILTFQGVPGETGPDIVATDGRGRAVVADLAPGPWQVEIAHPDYLTYIAMVDIRRGKKPLIGASFLEAGGRSLEPVKVKVTKGDKQTPSPVVEARRPATPPVARPEVPEPAPLPEVVEPAAEPKVEVEPSMPAEPQPAPEPTAPEPPSVPVTQSIPEQRPVESPPPLAVAAVPTPQPQPTPPSPSEVAVEEASAETPSPEPVVEAPTPEPEVVTPQPEPAPAPALPTPEVTEVPVEAVIAPAPEPAPPAQDESATAPSTPVPTPAPVAAVAALPPPPNPGAQVTSRSAGTCADCESAEWTLGVSVAVPAQAPGSSGRCDTAVLSKAQPAMAALSTSIQLELNAFIGPVADGSSQEAVRRAEPDLAQPFADDLAPYVGGTSPCQIVGLVLPKGVRFSRVSYAASDAQGGGACPPGQSCAIGDAQWVGSARVERGPSATIVYAVFENRSSERGRLARLKAYYRPPNARWQPRLPAPD